MLFKFTFRLLFVLLFFLSFQASAQVGLAAVKQWDVTSGGTSGDYLIASQQTADGGYVAAGYSDSNVNTIKTQASKGGTDFWIIKFNAAGARVWDKTYGTSLDDQLTAMQQTADGGYILGGYTSSGINGDKTQATKGGMDFWVVKLNSSGAKQWDKTFGGIYNDYLSALQQTSDGGYILGGFSESDIGGDKTQNSQGTHDYWAIKINASGTKQWDKTFGGAQYDELTAVRQTKDGGYFLAGHSLSAISGDRTEASRGLADYWVVKTNATGVKEWDKRFGGSSSDYCITALQTLDGGYILAGNSSSSSNGDKSQSGRGNSDFWLVKITATGTKKWDKRFGGSLSESCNAIVQHPDSSYLAAGPSSSVANGDKTVATKGAEDFWLLKVTPNGTKHWDMSFGGTNSDVLNSVRITADGGYLASGHSFSNQNSDKTDANLGSSDFWIMKLLPGAPLSTKEELIKAGYGLSQNFPNPFTGNTEIQFSLPKPEIVTLTLINSIGQVASEFIKRYPSGTSSLTLQDLPGAQKLPEGMYHYRLTAGEFTDAKKMVLLK